MFSSYIFNGVNVAFCVLHSKSSRIGSRRMDHETEVNQALDQIQRANTVFECFQVSRNLDLVVLQSAVKHEYRRLAKLVHPDKLAIVPVDQKEAYESACKKINTAYDIIQDQEQCEKALNDASPLHDPFDQTVPQATKPEAQFKPINPDDLKGTRLKAETRVKVRCPNGTIIDGTIKSHEGDNSFIVTLQLPTGEDLEEHVDAANLMLIDELEKQLVVDAANFMPIDKQEKQPVVDAANLMPIDEQEKQPVPPVPLGTSDKTSTPKKKSVPRFPLEKQGIVHLDGVLEDWIRTTTPSEQKFTSLKLILVEEGIKLNPIRSRTGAINVQDAFLKNKKQPLTEEQCKAANIGFTKSKKAIKQKKKEEMVHRSKQQK